jgi:transcriptional regulatory protein LevR/transcriptional regulator with AAA-type ATPase domain
MKSMKRIDKVHCYLEENTKQLSKEDILNGAGFTPIKIADDLNMLRNNVSKELNELLRHGKIIKIAVRPVRFLHKILVEEVLDFKFEEGVMEIKSINEIISNNEKDDPFKLLIGAEKSLKNQIEQAKAAIVYPPSGLNTLIVGQTGVGKTLFAKMMYNYGKYAGRFADKSPFIIFNCADYYNNAQLLLDYIFGHIKGAFTGADSEKPGLVEKANGGILFLDEIHRLPAEGQEMIFYFMDTGTYNKLGETERTRKADVLIIGATTEDPNSYMLKTFMRRIPMIINIPALQDRSNEEKIDIIKHLFFNEAHRINKPVKISIEVVKALIGSVTYGNIGQLKSNIELTCAKGFLNSINDNTDHIELDFKTLPPNIKDGFFEISRDRKQFQDLDNIIDTQLLISPEGYKGIIEGDSYEPPFNLYKLIEDKLSILKEEGMDADYINKFITTDVNIHIKSFYNKFGKGKENKDRILKIVDKEILEFAEHIKDLAEKELNRKYSDRFVYALSLHLSAFFKRIKQKKYDDKSIYDTVNNNDEEYKVALKVKNLISEKFNVYVPEAEVTYITILLKSIEEERKGQVGIVVAAHGNSTATSMVDVVKGLLGNADICAVDMPLDVSPKEILEIVIDKVKDMDSGRGVLLLVDMGSLAKFESTIIERTGIEVKSIDMVSTPLILEAVRKSSILDMELDTIHNSLKDFKGYNNYINEKNNASNNKVIVTVCASGKGTAEKLKEIVSKVVYDLTGESIKIIALGVRELDKKIKELQNKDNVLAVVGVKKPTADIPFISLEKLIDARGEKMLRELLINNNMTVIQDDEKITVKKLCENSLNEFLTYLNPRKIIGLLMEFMKILEKELGKELENEVKITIINHVAYALERMLTNSGLNYDGDKEVINKNVINSVDKGCEIFKKTLNLTLTEDEKYFICTMLN